LLREIEDHLTTLDDDFEPVATIRPLRGLRRRIARSIRFHEPFEEEEVLVDRTLRSE